MWKLISIEESAISGKKWRANFYDKVNDKRKHTDFGASGMEDYTMHQDDSRKDRYVKRNMRIWIQAIRHAQGIYLCTFYGIKKVLKHPSPIIKNGSLCRDV